MSTNRRKSNHVWCIRRKFINGNLKNTLIRYSNLKRRQIDEIQWYSVNIMAVTWVVKIAHEAPATTQLDGHCERSEYLSGSVHAHRCHGLTTTASDWLSAWPLLCRASWRRDKAAPASGLADKGAACGDNWRRDNQERYGGLVSEGTHGFVRHKAWLECAPKTLEKEVNHVHHVMTDDARIRVIHKLIEPASSSFEVKVRRIDPSWEVPVVSEAQWNAQVKPYNDIILFYSASVASLKLESLCVVIVIQNFWPGIK